MNEDFKARLDAWVREANYGLPGSEVVGMLEAALDGLRPAEREPELPLRPRGRPGPKPGRKAAAKPTVVPGSIRRGRPRKALAATPTPQPAPPQPGVPSGYGDDDA